MEFIPLASRDDPSPSSLNISIPLGPIWTIYTIFMDHGRRGPREHLYVAEIIVGIGGKECGCVSDICRVCRVCGSESKCIVRTKL